MSSWRYLKGKKAKPIPQDKPRDWRELAHPDLRSMTDGQFSARTSLLTRWWYSDAISWYGGAVRTWGDLGRAPT